MLGLECSVWTRALTLGAVAADAGAQRVRNSYAPVGGSAAAHFDDEGSIGRGGGYSSDGMYNNGRAAHQARQELAGRGISGWTCFIVWHSRCKCRFT